MARTLSVENIGSGKDDKGGKVFTQKILKEKCMKSEGAEAIPPSKVPALQWVKCRSI